MSRKLIIVCVSFIVFGLFVFGQQSLQADDEPTNQTTDPIAYIGHGVLFDNDGKEIQLTLAFIEEAYGFYLDTLFKQATTTQRALFEQKQMKLFSGQQWDKRSELYAKFALLAWLSNEVQPANTNDLSGKFKLLTQKLTASTLPMDPSGDGNEVGPFVLPNALNDLLVEEGLTSRDSGIAVASTTLGGAAYLSECSSAGVPIPPDWGTNQWVSRGVLTDEFISTALEAEVFTYQSNAPEGLCIALPRSQGNTISLLGIICLGKLTSNACFWDNQQNDLQFNISKGTVVPISQFAGGADLEGGSGGVCTNCHAGENPYIIHPNTALGLPSLGGLPLRSDNWYKPRVHRSWPQNTGPTNLLATVASPGQCTACHTQTGSGGRFPKLSTAITGYCRILQTAINRTMPPGSPNDPNYAAHANALMNACSQPPVNQPAGIPVTTLARYPDGKQLDLWVTGNDGNVYTAFFNEAAGGWRGPIQIAGAVPSGLPTGAPVTALARYPDGKQLDLWVTSNDGNVYTAFFNDAAGVWSGWFPVAGAVPSGLSAGALVAALARYPDGKQLDLWVTGNDGNVYTAFFNEAGGVWSGWIQLWNGAGSQPPQGSITVAQDDGTPPTLSLGVGQPGGQSGAVSDGGLGQTIKLISKTGPLNLIVTANDEQSGIQTVEVWVNRKITPCNTAGVCTTSGPELLSQPKFKSTSPQKQPGETTAASSIMAQVLDLSSEIPQGNVSSGASRTVELIIYAVAVNHRGGQARTPELNVVWSEP